MYAIHEQFLGRQRSEEDIIERIFRAERSELPVIAKYVPEGRILDFGCGSGELVKLLHDRGYEVWGFDPATRNVEFAKGRYGFATLTDSPEKLPKRCQAVTCMQVLQYVPDQRATLDLMASCLVEGGYLFISRSNPWSLFGLWAPRPCYELYDIPAHPELELISVEPGPSSARSSDAGYKHILKSLLTGIEKLGWLCGLKLTDSLIHIYRKI